MPRLEIKRQKEIDFAIEDLLQQTGAIDGYTVKLIDLAKALGIRVSYSPFLEKVGNVSGVIQYGEEPAIYLKESLNKQRKRFTLAHEIGHYLLHKKEGVDLRIDKIDYSSPSTIEETEANYFAGALLLPKEALLKAIDKGFSNKKIADLFGISEKVVEVRKQWIQAN